MGNHSYIDNNLKELTTYYYVITAFDEIPNESDYSGVISGVTKLGPHSPEINISLDDFRIHEDTIDNTSINLYTWFKDINDDVLNFSCNNNDHINVIIFQENGTVILKPEQNWNGQETIIFWVSDGEFKFSDDVTITVTPINDPPMDLEIILPVDGLEITEGKKLDFQCRCSDPDLPYGDELSFHWSSNHAGELGTENNLTGIKLPVGKHEITLTVTDSFGNSSYTTINVTVLKAESLLSEILISNINMVIILILIIFLIVLFILLKRRKAGRDKKEEAFDFEGFDEDIVSSVDERLIETSSGSTGGQQMPTKQRTLSKISKKALMKPTTELSAEFEKSVQQSLIIPSKQPIIDYQSKMIGRESELDELIGYLESGNEGHGNTIFIFGEVGIGKTRLVNEVKQVGEARGFQILSSNCVYESLTPFMPIREALRTGGLDYLFAEEAPNVEAVFLVSNSGLLIKEVIRQETQLNPDIFASMLTTVSNFVKDSLSMLSGESKEGALNTLGFENYRIIIESGRNLNLIVLLTGKENEFLINDMEEISQYMDKNYGDFIDTWDGDEAKLKRIEERLKPLITSGKYDGMYYGDIDPKTRRDLLFENVSMGLVRKSEIIPVLVCIEDLQWSDPSSLALIDYISRNSKNSRLVILCTYRPEEISKPDGTTHHLTEMIQIMEHEDLFIKMELSRLPKDSIGEILISILGGTDCNDEVRNLIYRETEGNPLFIIQLVKYLVEEKIIRHFKGTWKLAKNVEELNIPPKIYQVIARRLERLERKSREVLEYASVIGETFSSKILVKALKIPRLKLLARLRDLEQKYRLIHPDNGNYRFDHGKIKEVVYSNIPIELRIEYHSIIAKTIEKLNKDNLETVIEDLAFHYYQCKNKKKAYYYLLEAAKKAQKNYSIKEAIRFYNEALELEEVSSKKRDILDSIGEVYDTIGDYENSLTSFNEAIALTKDPRILADIEAKIGLIYLKKGDYDNSLRYGTEALMLVKNENSKEEASALETIGYTYHRIGEFEKALKHHKKSLEIRENLNDQKGIATSYKNMGMVHADRSDYRNALKNFINSLKIFRQLSNVQGIQDCLNKLGTLYFDKGEYKKAFNYFQKSLKIVKNTGDQNEIAIHLLNIGHSLLLIGEPDIALKNLNKSLAISKNNNLQTVIACNYWVMAEAYIEKSELSKALDYCNLAFDLAQKIDNKEIIASLKRVYGIIYKNQKKWKLSIRNFNESIKILKEIGNEQELGDSYYEYGLMWSSKGNSQPAKDNLKQAINIFRRLKSDKKLAQVKVALKRI
jgi:predicted ATPase